MLTFVLRKHACCQCVLHELQRYGDITFTSFRSGHTKQYALMIMHLARQLSACHAADATGASCQFSAEATAELRAIIVEKELGMFNPDLAVKYGRYDAAALKVGDGIDDQKNYWGWEQASDGCCGFDLMSAQTFRHFCHYVDNFGEEAKALNPTKYQLLVNKLSFYVADYESAFDQGTDAIFRNSRTDTAGV